MTKTTHIRHLLLVWLLPCMTTGAVAQLQGIRDEIAKIIRYESGIDFDIVPGLVIGVWDQQDTAYFNFGQGVESTDWFEMGSVTKPVTAHLVSLALEAQGYAPSTPMCTFIPDSICDDRWPEITVEHVLAHLAGLQRQPGALGLIEHNADDPYRHYDHAQLTSDLAVAKPMPGRYAYSHIGYGALSWIFHRLGGFIQFAEGENIHSGNQLQWHVTNDDMTTGYGFDGKPALPWNANALAPALGLKATIRGLTEFVMAEQHSLAMAVPALSSGLKKELAACEKTGAYKVVEGWFLIRSGKSIIFYHNGRTGGHHASVAFMPAAKKGVVVFANGTAGSNDLSLSILTMLRRARKK